MPSLTVMRKKVGCRPLQLTHFAFFSKLRSSLQCFSSPQFEKPSWCSGYATRLVNQGLQVLQSVGWDYKPRSRLHMTLAVGKTLNPNQPTSPQFAHTFSWYIYFHDGRKTGNCNIVEDLVRIPLSQIYIYINCFYFLWQYGCIESQNVSVCSFEDTVSANVNV